MEKPKCRLCGDRHYGLCRSVNELPEPEVVMKVSRHGVYKDKDKRREYQREWARKKRTMLTSAITRTVP